MPGKKSGPRVSVTGNYNSKTKKKSKVSGSLKSVARAAKATGMKRKGVIKSVMRKGRGR